MKNCDPLLHCMRGIFSRFSGKNTWRRIRRSKRKRKGGVDARIRSRVGHRKQIGPIMLADKVFIGEFLAVDGLAARTLHERPVAGQQPDTVFNIRISITMSDRRGNKNLRMRSRTLPLVKSPPWSMKPGMIRWNLLPSYPNPLSPVQRARKFSAVLGTTSP